MYVLSRGCAGADKACELGARQPRRGDRVSDPRRHLRSIRVVRISPGALDGQGEQAAHPVGFAVGEVALDAAGHLAPWGSAQLDEDGSPVPDQAPVDDRHERFVGPGAHIVAR